MTTTINLLPMSALTPHVTLNELISSTTARRLGIDNTPSDSVLVQLRRLAEMIKLVRAELGHIPIYISSGYRCLALNKAVGGATHSAHVAGRAVDFTAPRFGTPLMIFRRLAKSALSFDQLIYENNNGATWVHLGIAEENSTPRRQVLTIDSHGTKAGL
jgi:hypothetical protein